MTPSRLQYNACNMQAEHDARFNEDGTIPYDRPFNGTISPCGLVVQELDAWPDDVSHPQQARIVQE